VVVSGNTNRYTELPNCEHQSQVRLGEALRTWGPMLTSLAGVGTTGGAKQTPDERSENAIESESTLMRTTLPEDEGLETRNNHNARDHQSKKNHPTESAFSIPQLS
jgi:hypothetical protein